MTDQNSTAIVKDFAAKQDSYYLNNYGTQTRENFVRRFRRDRILSLAKLAQRRDAVLDVGSGPAILYEELLESSNRYVAVDLVSENIEKIRQGNRSSKLELICTDVDNLEFGRERFDLVICSGSLEYTKRPLENIERLLHYLNPGGRIIATLPQSSSPFRIWGENVYTPASQALKSVFGRETNRYGRKLFASQEIRKRLEPLVSECRFEFFGYKVIPQPFDRVLAPIDSYITRKLQAANPSMFGWMCIELIVVLDK